MNVKEQVYGVVKDLVEGGVETISDDTTLASLGIDSLNLMDLVFRLQELCEVEFGDKDLLPSNLATVGSIIATVTRLRG